LYIGGQGPADRLPDIEITLCFIVIAAIVLRFFTGFGNHWLVGGGKNQQSRCYNQYDQRKSDKGSSPHN